MGAHAIRGAVSAWLALIVLQALVTTDTGRLSGAFTGLNNIVQRALSPNVPAIPDRRAGAKPAAGAGGFFNMTPAQVAAAKNLGDMAPVIGQAAADPNGVLGTLANLDPNALAHLGAFAQP